MASGSQGLVGERGPEVERGATSIPLFLLPGPQAAPWEVVPLGHGLTGSGWVGARPDGVCSAWARPVGLPLSRHFHFGKGGTGRAGQGHRSVKGDSKGQVCRAGLTDGGSWPVCTMEWPVWTSLDRSHCSSHGPSVLLGCVWWGQGMLPIPRRSQGKGADGEGEGHVH